MHTRYSKTNVLLLIGGALVMFVHAFFVSLTAGFSTDPAHDLSSIAQICFLYTALSAVPSFLTMFRWSRIGFRAMWCITIVCSTMLIVAGRFLRFGGDVLLLFVAALICTGIYTGSKQSAADLNSSKA